MKNILIILLFIPFQLFAQHWWVDNTGTGDTLATIAEVNALGSGQDDTISFKKGCTWRETLTIPASGAAGHYVVYNTYGIGDAPKILGSDISGSWTAEGHANIWQSTADFLDPYNIPDMWEMEIFFEETTGDITWGDAKKAYTSNFSNLVNEYDWTWNADRVYVYAASDPDTRYTEIEIPQRDFIISLNEKQYIEIDGMDLYYGVYGVAASDYPTGNYTGVKVRNCHIGYLGTKDGAGYGVHICYNDVLIEYDTIHDCGRRGVSIINYGSSDIDNIIVQYCEFYNGFHTTGIDIETGGNAGSTGDLNDIHVRNCLMYDLENRADYAAELNFIQGPHGGTGQVLGAYFYNNILKFSSMAAIHIEDADGCYIYNNTFYGHNNTIAGNTFHVFCQDGSTNIKIKNNIFYTLLNYDTGGSGLTIYEDGTQNHTQIDANYNLHYRINNSLRIIIANENYFYMDDQATIISNLGWETNGVFDNPDFINITNPVDNDSLMIDILSPAVDAGIGLGAYSTYDYRDSLRDASPDIGAFEYGAEDFDPPDPPTITTTTPVVIYTRLASSGGSSLDDGGGTISAKGLCWSTSANPTILDSKVVCGTGESAFSGYITGLAAGTTYHCRAYATNATATSYGADIEFTTPIHSTAKTGGKILKTGGKIVIIH